MHAGGPRILSALTGGELPTVAAQAVGMTIHSYAGMSLAVEHWERPPPLPCPIGRLCPFGGYRRRQNLFRWFARRVRAGDRLPNFTLPPASPVAGASVGHGQGSLIELALQKVGVGGEGGVRGFLPTGHGFGRADAPLDERAQAAQIYPYDHGWMLLLCEGTDVANRDLAAHVANPPPTRTCEQLWQLGTEMRAECALIGSVHVLPHDHAATELLGVEAQCLFLVRPDSHVALRCEPLRPPVVYRYLRNQLGAHKGIPSPPDYWLGDGAPMASPTFDALPAAGAFVLLSLLGPLAWVGGSYTVHVEFDVNVAYLWATLGAIVIIVSLLATNAAS